MQVGRRRCSDQSGRVGWGDVGWGEKVKTVGLRCVVWYGCHEVTADGADWCLAVCLLGVPSLFCRPPLSVLMCLVDTPSIFLLVGTCFTRCTMSYITHASRNTDFSG